VRWEPINSYRLLYPFYIIMNRPYAWYTTPSVVFHYKLTFNWPASFQTDRVVLILSPIHTADADETKLSSLVASAVCT